MGAMNMEAKPMASLSSGLLARKGDAKPAMRRPMIQNSGVAPGAMQDDLGWNDMGYDVNPDQSVPMDHEHDLGFNPLANAVPEVKPEVRQQQERIAEQLQAQADEASFADADEAMAAEVVPIAAPVLSSKPANKQQALPQAAAPKASVPRPRAAPGSKGKAAFTLRLDADRHLKLRLACAVSNRSAQQIVTAALDIFIESFPELSTLAAHVPGKKSA
jgi:hypothetical protein